MAEPAAALAKIVMHFLSTVTNGQFKTTLLFQGECAFMNISASKVYKVTSPRRWKASQDVKDHKRKPLGAGELKVGVTRH